MKKIVLVIKREYLTRVRKKTFILATILFPVLYFGLIIGTGYLAANSNDKLNIAIIDSSGFFDRGTLERENLKDSTTILTSTTASRSEIEKNYEKQGYDGFVIIPSNISWEKGIDLLPLYSSRTLSIESSNQVQRKLNNIWSALKNEKLGIDDAKKQVLENSTVNLLPQNLNDKNANSQISTILAFVAAFLMYIILLMYGSQVMMGVTEEKTSRIAEVIVSSVKPFQLMIGKIVGIGLVAITQFTLWILFVFVIYNVTKSSGNSSSMNDMVGGMQNVFSSINVPLILFSFGFYLLAGFFFYASMFAAVGSAVNEDMREAQSLSFPLMMPIIFSIATIQVVLKDPTGPLAVWGSIIPFTSPIYMMVRIPFGVPGTVPVWQLVVSMLTLIIGFIFTTWFAGKIYRTGILMYGKKPSWKEMLKWAFRKG